MAVTVPSVRGNIIPDSDHYQGFRAYAFRLTGQTNDLNCLRELMYKLYNFDWLNSDKNVQAISSIISCHYIPKTVALSNDTSQLFSVGAQSIDMANTMHFANNRFQIFKERVIEIPHPYNNYLDYPPYTRVILHLPFIGEREIDHTPFLQQDGEYKGKIYTHWSIDIWTGDLTCFVTDHDEYVYYSYTGNCAIKYPLSGADYSQQAAGAAQAITGAITTVGGFVAENPMVAAMGMMSTSAGLVKAFQPPRTTINGSITSSHGYQGIWTSYITVTRPKFDASYEAQGYAVKGKPCHKYVALNTLENTGFTKIAEIKMKNFPGQKSELDECLALLKEGVLL